MARKQAGPGGRRKFEIGHEHDINVTPFVDVMLVLLIVFMVAAPIATATIKVDIPPGVSGPRLRPPAVITLSRDGQLSVSTGPTTTENHPATLDKLSGLLAQALGGASPQLQQVFIHADQHVHYGKFMAVVNRLQLDGYYKVGIISEEVHL